MKIAFLDLGGWEYTVDTPLTQPMGGTESALCYLAMELAAFDNEVTIYNGTKTAMEAIAGLPLHYRPATDLSTLNSHDVVIVKASPVGRELRGIGVKVPMYLWLQHDVDQPAVKPLLGRKEVDAWTGIVFVSEWQRNRYVEFYRIPVERTLVMRNAVSPAFLTPHNPPSPWTGFGAPVLWYASTPYRGLNVLLDAWPKIREATGASLRVYSSMSVYRADPAADAAQFGQLYDGARTMQGVTYCGSMGQSDLVHDLATYNLAGLAYPSTFPETSCIAALEAQALGAEVMSTNLGALPETTGSDSLLPFTPDLPKLVEAYAAYAIARIEWGANNPEEATTAFDARRQRILDAYTWPIRALDWTYMLKVNAAR